MTRTGALYGLSLRLHVGQDDYFETQVSLHLQVKPPITGLGKHHRSSKSFLMRNVLDCFMIALNTF